MGQNLLVETVFPPPVRLPFLSVLHFALTASSSNLIPYLHPGGFFCRALRFPGLKSYRTPGGLAPFLHVSCPVSQAALVVLGFFVGRQLGILRICAGLKRFPLSLESSYARLGALHLLFQGRNFVNFLVSASSAYAMHGPLPD